MSDTPKTGFVASRPILLVLSCSGSLDFSHVDDLGTETSMSKDMFLLQGIYTSDTFAKSVNYCCNSNPKSDIKLALLCEVCNLFNCTGLHKRKVLSLFRLRGMLWLLVRTSWRRENDGWIIK